MTLVHFEAYLVMHSAEQENMSIYEILHALDLTQYVLDKFNMHRNVNFQNTYICMFVLVTSLEIQSKKFLWKSNCNKIIMKVPWAPTHRAAQSVHGCRIGGALSMWDYSWRMPCSLKTCMLSMSFVDF